MPSRTVLALTALTALTASTLAATPAAAAGPRVVMVTTPATGGAGNEDTPAISADRRFVAFTAGDVTCRAGWSETVCGVYRRDLGTGAVVLVSATATGAAATEDSFGPSISADGRYVSFTSDASLTPDGTGGVFRRDVQTGTTVLVAAGAGQSSISADGSRVAYVSGTDVSVRDLTTGVTTPAAPGMWPSLSADGRFVAFHSDSALLPADTNSGPDIYVTDIARRRTTLVSVSSTGEPAPDANWGYIEGPSISANGRFVAFASHGSTLVPGDTNEAPDIFVHDRRTGITERVSVSSTGQQLSGFSRYTAISGSGRYVAFQSDAPDAVPGDTNDSPDIFVRDRVAGTTTRVSTAPDGTQSRWGGSRPTISADGRGVAYLSYPASLQPGDPGLRDEVFARLPR